MKALVGKSEALRKELTEAVDLDAASFVAVMDAFKLPKDTPEQQQARLEAVEKATLEATEVPLQTARKAVDVMGLVLEAVSYGNLTAITDAATGAALERAALTAAGLNVRINAKSLQDRSAAQAFIDKLVAVEKRAADLDEQIAKQLRERGGLELP
jgi:glutamate formiminotransferase/formiminotetrahydrofolate cyclodeaminase